MVVATASAQPAEPRVRTLEALDAVVRGSVLYAVDPDGTSVRAIDLATDAVKFVAPIGTTENAALVHDLGRDRILVQTPHRLVTIDTTSGSVVFERPIDPGWRFVWRSAGACALRWACDFEPIDCATGRPIGQAFHGTYSHRRRVELGGEHHPDTPHCESDFEVLGRAGDLSIFAAGPVRTPLVTDEKELFAIASDGSVRWHRADLACVWCAPLGSGVADDGSLCWSSAVASETSIVVRAFDCASGRPRFTANAAREPTARDPELVTGWVHGAGLFLLEPTRARLLAPNGRPRWSRSVGRTVFVAPESATYSYYPLSLPAFETIEYVRVATGATTRTASSEGRDLRIDDEGRVAFQGRGQAGNRAGGPAPTLELFSFDRTPTRSAASFGGREVLTVPGDAWAIGEARIPSGVVLAVVEPNEGHPDRVHLVRVDLRR